MGRARAHGPIALVDDSGVQPPARGHLSERGNVDSPFVQVQVEHLKRTKVCGIVAAAKQIELPLPHAGRVAKGGARKRRVLLEERPLDGDRPNRPVSPLPPRAGLGGAEGSMVLSKDRKQELSPKLLAELVEQGAGERERTDGKHTG